MSISGTSLDGVTMSTSAAWSLLARLLRELGVVGSVVDDPQEESAPKASTSAKARSFVGAVTA
ncbi:MAG: hypothetical protein DRI90_15545 [Deltaproteobacteria bacterium]|nr:MAG: hypothetical protein DRI90_15545 [Deltaproteobacteria bacterium]